MLYIICYVTTCIFVSFLWVTGRGAEESRAGHWGGSHYLVRLVFSRETQ